MPAITKLVDRFTETDIDEEIVIMQLSSGEFFSLSETASAIWRLLDGYRDRAALIAALTEEFGIDPNLIAAEVDEFLLQLREAGLIARD